jgi:hypothetical protein
MPGDTKEEFYDPAVLNRQAAKWFMQTIGFAGERVTTLEKGLDSIEQVLQKLEDCS